MQIGLGLWLGTRQVGGFNPAAVLFGAGEQGGWYDSSDLSTMFQDSAGTTPVTATGQTVGLLLDKSQGLALGPELVTNGDFSDGATGWTLGTDWSISDGSAQRGANATASNLIGGSGVQIGKTYRITWTQGPQILAIYLGSLAGPLVSNTATAGTYTRLVVATATGGIVFRANTDVTLLDNISVKELAGNHLTQTTAASRPIYGIEPFGGRRNLLTRTEEFDNAAWLKVRVAVTDNAVAAPDGTLTADTMTAAAGAGTHYTRQLVSVVAATAYALSVYAKAGTHNFIQLLNADDAQAFANFNILTGVVGSAGTRSTASITHVGNGWYRCTVVFAASAFLGTDHRIYAVSSAAAAFNESWTAAGTETIFLWGAQLETGSLATPYQRVTDQWNVTEAGVPSVSYVQYDGTDDWFISPTITPGIDKAQVFAGVRKLSDAAVGIVAESGTGTENGIFVITAPRTGGVGNYRFISKGTVLADAFPASGYSAPITNVLTGIGDIAGDVATLRVNGVQAATSATDQGTGNYLAYPLYVGRRGGTSLPFNGRMYQLIVRFGANLDASTIAATEAFVETKTGAIPPLNATLNLDFLANAYEAGI